MKKIEQSSVKERLKEFLKYKNLSQKKFEEICGLSNGYVNSMRKSIKPETYDEQIAPNFPELNKVWLLLGKGEMLKSSEETPIKGDEVKAVPYDNYMMVEYADLGTSAGILGGGDNPAYLPETKRRLVPKEFDSGKYLVVGVYGDSMDDGSSISIPHGTEILIKECILSNGEKLPIRNNLFVIVSRSGTVFKQIIEHNTEKGYIMCRSYNPKYKDYKILLEEVIQIFVFRKVVSYRPFIPEIN
ncbi:S24 family peptidase [Riemerella anatipestifer]|uniref:S24 family peptidase n=1 Tax=Riemerella anatipestifer TaxID=34085 RepID=UPI00236341F7|nr:S24 family peptidase [Riemerella anatipestifer]MDD1539685.1 helix-turn-helix transcriptional regulator [Riemerella anatipestifer]